MGLDLQPGDLFTIDGTTAVFECVEVVRGEKATRPKGHLKSPIFSAVTDEIEVEPWVRSWELEGPRGALRRRQFRAIRLTRVTGKIDGRVTS